MPPKAKVPPAPATPEQRLLDKVKDVRRSFANVLSDFYEIETNHEESPQLQPALASVGLTGESDFHEFNGRLDGLVSRLQYPQLTDRDVHHNLEIAYGKPEDEHRDLYNVYRDMSRKVAALRVRLEGQIVKSETEEESENEESSGGEDGEEGDDTGDFDDGDDDDEGEEDSAEEEPYRNRTTTMDVDALSTTTGQSSTYDIFNVSNSDSYSTVRRSSASSLKSAGAAFKRRRGTSTVIQFPDTKSISKRIAYAEFDPPVLEGFRSYTKTAQSIWEIRFGGDSGNA